MKFQFQKNSILHVISYKAWTLMWIMSYIHNKYDNIIMMKKSVWLQCSGGHLKFYSKNVSFCPSPTNDIPKNKQKTIKEPFKSPSKMLPEIQNFFWIFQNLLVFKAFFEKAVFLENGHGRYQTGATPIHYTVIFTESQWRNPPTIDELVYRGYHLGRD